MPTRRVTTLKRQYHSQKDRARGGRSRQRHERRQRRDLSIVAVIPLYNGAKWIEAAIRSVLSQKLQPDEIVVVDDGSTDDGPIIVQRLAAQHHHIKLLHKPNGGQSSARNFGIRRTTSALIALLDQDDEWYYNHLDRLVRPFREDRVIPLGWAYSDLDEFDEGGALVQRGRLSMAQPVEHPKRSLAACLSQDMFVVPSASLMSREAFEKVGGFDERLCGYEDDDLFLRIFRAGYDNVFVNESLSRWTIHPSSVSYSERMSASRMIYAHKLAKTFFNDRKMRRYWVRDCIAPRFVHTLLNEYGSALLDRDTKRAGRAIRDLKVLVPNLSPARRIRLSILLPLLRIQPLVRTIRTLPLARRFVARILS